MNTMRTTKKKKYIIATIALALVTLIIALAVGLSGGVVFKTNPGKDADAIGNGGMAVMKGEYIYFVNGFKEASENFNKNRGSKIEQGAIYRVKADGAEYEYDAINKTLNLTPGTLTELEEGGVEGAERLVSKVAGFEQTKIWIFGSTMYFTSPSTTRDARTGEINTSFVDVWSININGSKLKRIYTISNFSNGQINFYRNGKDVYGIFFDGVKRLAIYKNGKKHITKTDVSQLVMPTFDQDFLAKTIDGKVRPAADNRSEQIIAYVIDRKEDDKTVTYLETLAFPNANNGNFVTKESKLDNSITLIELKCGKLFYEYNYPNNFQDGNYLFHIDANQINSFDIAAQSRTLMRSTFTSHVAAKGAGGATLIAYRDSEVFVFEEDNDYVHRFGISDGATLLFANGTDLIYKTSSSIFKVNYGKNADNTPLNITGNTVVLLGTQPVSFDGTWVYYFKQITITAPSTTDGSGNEVPGETITTNYLERVNVYGAVDGENGGLTKQELSKRLEKHYNEIEEPEVEDGFYE